MVLLNIICRFVLLTLLALSAFAGPFSSEKMKIYYLSSVGVIILLGLLIICLSMESPSFIQILLIWLMVDNKFKITLDASIKITSGRIDYSLHSQNYIYQISMKHWI